ncbi:MAG: universal stress protein [Exilibacterium sp.]
MTSYNHILVGVDLSEESPKVIERAQSLAEMNKAKVSITHIIEPLTFAYGGDIPMDLSEVQDQLQQQATIQLAKLAQSVNVPPERQHVVIGQPATEMHQLADQQQVDLIVVGSHGRHGLALLLGSTANAVLHGASCDVLAVRV